jgi:serine/threonine protein kinase
MVPVTSIPSEGDRVLLADATWVFLGKRLAHGGEGVIFAVQGGKVAKIYRPGRFSVMTLEKLRLMSAAKVAVDGACWPDALLHNERGEPVGFLMLEAAGFPLSTSVFVKPLLEKKLPKWTRTNLVRLAIRVAETVGALHRHGLVVGDINPNNILITPDGRVTLVDLDSAQVGDMPCLVGMASFTRPQRQGQPYASYLREREDDYFALSTLIFMILMPGKSPYSHAGGADPAENVRKRHFPYRTQSRAASGVPDGPWRYMWSHLSFRVKKAFEEAFMHDRPPSPRDWIEHLRAYEKALGAGRMDPEQGDVIFPTRFKRLSKDVEERYGIELESLVQVPCSNCSKLFDLSEEATRRHKVPVCPECLSDRRAKDQEEVSVPPAALEQDDGLSMSNSGSPSPASSGSNTAPSILAMTKHYLRNT